MDDCKSGSSSIRWIPSPMHFSIALVRYSYSFRQDYSIRKRQNNMQISRVPMLVLGLLAPSLATPTPQTGKGDQVWVCGMAGLKSGKLSSVGLAGGFREAQFFLSAGAEDFQDAKCMARVDAISWVTLQPECRCQFFDDKECKEEHSKTSMGQGRIEREDAFEGAWSYKCGWGYE